MVNCEGEFGIMWTQEEQSWRARSRSSPKFQAKMLTLALLASVLLHKPASAVLLPQRNLCGPPSTRDSDSSSKSLVGDMRKHHGGRRTLLQDGRWRPSPMGYPPPGNNQQGVQPHRSPSFPNQPP